ncbi:hypothetical protein [Gorillibacterium sp. sgz5001074]|uniref:hypothetical protein n=1 Tax=Gorillibacterium sp. sgz5001074 TaxID=3446695 RepID=UPI003F679F02
MNLNPATDFIYGLIGMGASLAGFFIWGLALKKKLVDSISGTVGSVGKDLFGNSFKSAVSEVGSKVPLATNLLLLGIISLLVLFGALWLLGNWKGQVKMGWKEIVTYLGTMQLPFGAAYAAAAILAFLSLKLSLLLVAVGLLTALLMTCFGAQEIYQYSKEQRFAQYGMSMALYAVIVLVASNILLKDAFSSLILP